MFIIQMNPDDNPHEYLGAICIINDNPYYITGEAPPTLFKTEDEAKKMVKELSRLRKKVEFEIKPIALYLTLMSPMWDDQCKWLKPMRKKYGVSIEPYKKFIDEYKATHNDTSKIDDDVPF